MGVTVGWDDEAQRAVRFDLQDKWTLKEWQAAMAQAIPMAESVDHPVDVIVDIRASQMPPTGALMEFRQATIIGRRYGHVILVTGDNVVMQMIVAAFNQAYCCTGAWVLAATSLEEARATLARMRAEE